MVLVPVVVRLDPRQEWLRFFKRIPFIGIAAFATAVFALLGIAVLALSGLLATLFVCYFFRDPDRVTPVLEGGVVSPADGKVIKVERLENTRFVEGQCSTFAAILVAEPCSPCYCDLVKVSGLWRHAVVFDLSPFQFNCGV